jgi:hypothetical protein
MCGFQSKPDEEETTITMLLALLSEQEAKKTIKHFSSPLMYYYIPEA